LDLSTEPSATWDIEDMREQALGFLRWSRPADHRINVLDLDIDDTPVPIRLYRPRQPNRGLVVYVHGGGWVSGSIELADRICRRLSYESGCAVASIDYRLAPEHPYPTGLNDCFRALCWLQERRAALDCAIGPLVLVGESAGGALVASMALMARANGSPTIDHQVLIYPALDDRLTNPSFGCYGGQGALLTTEAMRFYWHHYLAGSRDELAIPALADNLAGLPRTTVFVCEADPLHDEGVEYAHRLAASGVSVNLVENAGLPHAAMYLDGISNAASEFVSTVATAIRLEID